MSKFAILPAAAAAAFLVMGGGAAMAEISLPNDKWSIVVLDSSEQTTSGHYYIWNGNHCKKVAAVEISTVTTYAAQNPGGNIVLSKGTETESSGSEVAITNNANLGNVQPGAEGCIQGQNNFVAS